MGTIIAETTKAETVIIIINKIGLGLDFGILILDSWLLILIPSVKSLLFSFLIFVFSFLLLGIFWGLPYIV